MAIKNVNKNFGGIQFWILYPTQQRVWATGPGPPAVVMTKHEAPQI